MASESRIQRTNSFKVLLVLSNMIRKFNTTPPAPAKKKQTLNDLFYDYIIGSEIYIERKKIGNSQFNISKE